MQLSNGLNVHVRVRLGPAAWRAGAQAVGVGLLQGAGATLCALSKGGVVGGGGGAGLRAAQGAGCGMGQPPRGRARSRSRTCSSAAAALGALGVAVAVCTAFGIQRGGVDESDGTAGGHAVHAVRLQDADVAGGHRNARDEARAPPRGVSQTPACSLERYWARVEEYYDGNSAQQQAAARDSRPSPTRLFEQHHLCAAQQRQLGWHALHGGRRGEPASGPLGLSVMGVEGTGHHVSC